MYLGNQPTFFNFIYAVSEGSKMGLVLYFGGGCLFPLYLFSLSFIVIYSFFLGLKNVGIHSIVFFVLIVSLAGVKPRKALPYKG